MQRVTREHRFQNYGDLSTLPETPPLRVGLGEAFVVETIDTTDRLILSEEDMEKPSGPLAGNPSTGPVFVEGVRAGEVIAVHIEDVRVVGHCDLSVGERPRLPKELAAARRDFVRIENGLAHFRGGLEAPVRPMLGCFGVVPAEPSPEPWHHGGNMDIREICAGNVVHVRCQREGALFACGDGHAVQGDGEVAAFSLEVSLEAELRIERSPHRAVRTMVIESPSELITVGIEQELGDSVTSAVHAMSELVAERRGVDLLDAYQFAVHVGDLRLGAMWPLWSEWQMPVPACLHLAKEYVG